MALTLLAGDNAATAFAFPSGATTLASYMLGNGSGSFLIAVHATSVSGTSPSLVVKAQDSPDGVTFTDITGAATTAVTAAGNTVGFGHSVNKYVRLVGTITGSATPVVTATVTLAGFGAV